MKDADCVLLQDKYIQTRNEKDLNKFYRGCIEIGYSVFSGLQRGNPYIKELPDTIVTEAVNDFIMRYHNNPLYRKEHIVSSIHFIIYHKLHDKTLKTSASWFYKYNSQIPEDYDVPVEKQDKGESTNTTIQDILEDHPQGSNILVAASISHSYREFIKRVSRIVGDDTAGRRWVYDHAKRLHDLYKNTRP